MVLLVATRFPAAVLVAVVAWGIAFGGAATQLQTAVDQRRRPERRRRQLFMLGVAFNLAIFAAGVARGRRLGTRGLGLPVVMAALGLVALALTVYGRRSAFPARL